jgi:hypothetical protein
VNTTSTVGRHFTWTLVAAALVFVLPALAAAQEPVTSFDQLNTRLKPGDKVWVTDAQGREIEGRIRSLSDAALTLGGGDAPTFTAADVRSIQDRRPDSLKNGLLWGGVIGLAALAGAAVAVCSGGDCEWDAARVVVGVPIYTAAGMGIGAAIDAAVPGKKRTVYLAGAASSGPRLSLAPIVTPRARGVAVSFSF